MVLLNCLFFEKAAFSTYAIGYSTDYRVAESVAQIKRHHFMNLQNLMIFGKIMNYIKQQASSDRFEPTVLTVAIMLQCCVRHLYGMYRYCG